MEKYLGYVVLANDISLTINKNGTEQTIIKSVIDSYKQIMSTIRKYCKRKSTSACN
jgi:hypothetical protein